MSKCMTLVCASLALLSSACGTGTGPNAPLPTGYDAPPIGGMDEPLTQAGFQAAGYANAPWPSDVNRTRQTVVLGPAVTPRLLWHFDIPASLPEWDIRSTIDTDGTIYVGMKGGLYAIAHDGNGGKIANVWIEGGAPTLAENGAIYVICKDALCAFDKTGHPLWTSKADGDVQFSTPVLGSDGTVYYRSAESVYAVRPDGSERWRKPIAGLQAIVVGRDGTVYVESGNQIYAFASDGSERWRYQGQTGQSYTSPFMLGPDGTLYTASWRVVNPPPNSQFASELLAIDAVGNTHWSSALEGNGYATGLALAANGTIYVATSDGQLHAIGLDGAARWRASCGKPAQSSMPIIDKGGAVYATCSSRVWAVNPDGSPRWTLDLPPDVTIAGQSSLSMDAEGRLYVPVELPLGPVFTTRVYAIGR